MHLFHASLELSPPQSHLTQTVRGQVNLDFAKKKKLHDILLGNRTEQAT